MKSFSDEWYQRAITRIPMGTQTSSKAAFRFADGFGPKFLSHGSGCTVVDLDGEEYIDWTMALGAITAGYAHPRIQTAVDAFSGYGNLLTLPTVHEDELAQVLCSIVPGMERVRFLKTGSDATSAAVRLARAFTGRDHIVRCGYHGWHDWALNADYADCAGVPQCVRDLTISVPYADLEALEDQFLGASRAGQPPAAFILEPVCLHAPPDWYLPRVRDLCTRYGVVLIFDETITGIRLARGGAQEYFGVTADLVTYGKGLANGHALAAVGGRADIMDGFTRTHISGTYNGEIEPLVGAIENIMLLQKGNYWTHQRRIGQRLIDGYQAISAYNNLTEHTRIIGMPHFTSIVWDDAAEGTLFQQEMMRRGILHSGNQFPALCHTDGDADTTVEAYHEAMDVVSRAIDDHAVASRLECAVNKPVFVRRP